jgi:hypothetical protein
LVPLQFVEEQTEPAQHAFPVAPHATHLLVPLWQTNGSPQNPPDPRFGVQHGWPSPPHATQVPFEHVLEGAVHATPPPQHASPICPHAPP